MALAHVPKASKRVTISIEEHAADVAASAPPLSPEKLDRLKSIFAPRAESLVHADDEFSALKEVVGE